MLSLTSGNKWAAGAPRVMPGPLRSARAWTHAPAREQLECSLDLCSPAHTHALYVHVPFCRPRCPFCDLYCFSLDDAGEAEELARYEGALRREINWHTQREGVRTRPVSTLHFGGGTPLSLGADRLCGIVEGLRASFAFGAETEVAVELRVTDLTAENLGRLSDGGIRRLHVGVQTLDDAQRSPLGRRGGGGEVLDSLQRALATGAIVSVDMLYGLPGQNEDSFLAGLEQLCAIELHGFALYELHRTHRNVGYFEAQKFIPDRAANFALFESGANFLESRGFHRGYFTHFSRPADRNLYSTHPARGEDCLGFGPIADSHAAGAAWRNHGYAHWLKQVETHGCGVEALSLYLPEETRLLRIETELMSCTVSRESLRDFASCAGRDSKDIEDEWLEAGLAESTGELLALTAKGIWLHGNMLEDLRASLFAALGARA